jgi:transposase-like protein
MMRHWPLSSITTDQLGYLPRAIIRLQRTQASHRPTRGFQTMKTAAATIEGFEVMRMICQGQCFTCKPHVSDEVRFVNKLFDLFEIVA